MVSSFGYFFAATRTRYADVLSFVHLQYFDYCFLFHSSLSPQKLYKYTMKDEESGATPGVLLMALDTSRNN